MRNSIRSEQDVRRILLWSASLDADYTYLQGLIKVKMPFYTGYTVKYDGADWFIDERRLLKDSRYLRCDSSIFTIPFAIIFGMQPNYWFVVKTR